MKTCELEPSVDHNHCTTRQFQHMCFWHNGVWFAFYSDGEDFVCQTSADKGNTWQRAPGAVAPAPNGSTGFDVLKVGETVYISHALYPLGRYDVNAPYARDPARRGEYTAEGRVKKGRIEGRSITWLMDVNPGFIPDYGNLVRDTEGKLWIFARQDGQVVAYLCNRPENLTDWLPKAVCIPNTGRHAMDAAALSDGKLYVASVLTTGSAMYGNLYDGKAWKREATLLSANMTTVAGDDRRVSLEFDPTQKRLHLVYVDADNKLRHRQLDSPYQLSNWLPPLEEPGRELAAGVFTCAVSVDSSVTPHDLVITYGIEKHVGSDERQRTGEIYARRFDGAGWVGEAMLVSQPGTVYNWYPNVSPVVRDELCVMYSRSLDEGNLWVQLAVMVSVLQRIGKP